MAEVPGARGLHLRAAALMLASGFAGLGYQVIWTQQSAAWLGHEAAAMLAIVAAFFGGIGAGALALGRRIAASSRPVAWYAVAEAVIGLWALALIYLMEPASRLLLHAIGPEPSALRQWSVAFGGAFLLLLPATVAMGATLPAMEKLLAALRAHRQPVAWLYAANTTGAVLGVVLSAFALVPWLGLSRTALLCVAVNLGCALLAARWRGIHTEPGPPAAATSSRSMLFALCATGLLGIGFEVLTVRALSQVAENTMFTFAILLAVYLFGTAGGAAAYGRWRREPDEEALRQQLFRWQALSCLLGVSGLVLVAPMKSGLASFFGGGMTGALAAETLIACVAFLPATLVMGALFSHLVSVARASGASVGTSLGVNTLAAAFAPLLFGVVALPRLGVIRALLLVSVTYLLLVAPRAWRSWAQGASVAAAAAGAFWLAPNALVAVPPGGKLLSLAEGVSATVSVVEDTGGTVTLHINNRQQEGSNITLYSDARQGLLPVLLHPQPRRVLFLGLGTGATARAVASNASIQVEAAELLPEVIEAAALFETLQQGERTSKLRMLAIDARRHVRATTKTYDVIVADNFHPARSGSAALYTVEHFAAVRERLAPGGLFCQWLPLHQIDLPTLKSIVRSYTSVYPKGWAILATNSLDTPVVGLISRRDGEPLDSGLPSRLEAAHLDAFGMDDELAVLGTFIAGGKALEQLGRGAPLNTDDHPVVSWLAPRITYSPDSQPRDRLMALLQSVEVSPHQLFASENTSRDRRLSAYWSARNRYLDIGRRVTPTRDVRAMLAQTGAPLLGVLRISADFRPAIGPLTNMARELERTDPEAAHALMNELAAIRAAGGTHY